MITSSKKLYNNIEDALERALNETTNTGLPTS
jgi:hypothetical protein